jgi:vacuolar-type H+-ATPase subunit H
MEELQSTETLDREILEDARKKAQRILKTADDTVQAKSAEWDTTTAKALNELAEKFSAQGKVAAEEIMALLPIDKHRIKATKIDELLRSAVETWYNGLSRQRVLELLTKELARRLDFFKAIAEHDKSAISGAIHAFIHKVEPAEAQAVLQAVLPGKTCHIETIQSTAAYPEIILETPDLRIYASIGKTVDFFLGEQRAELIEALLGKAALPGQSAISGEELW